MSGNSLIVSDLSTDDHMTGYGRYFEKKYLTQNNIDCNPSK